VKAVGRTRSALSLSPNTLFKQHLNNVIEQDHRFITKRIAASLWFRSVEGALRTIDGYEAMHLIRKGQIRWLQKGDVVGQRQFIHNLFGIAA
jgi:transposase-like protein